MAHGALQSVCQDPR